MSTVRTRKKESAGYLDIHTHILPGVDDGAQSMKQSIRMLRAAAMEGIADLCTSVRMANRRLNRQLYIEGVLLTMYDGRLNFAGQVAQELRRYFGDRVYESVIPRNVRLAEAPSHGVPITEYDRQSKGAKAYLRAADEFLKRQV